MSGCIGKSKHPKISFQLATKLFEKSESRGTDASGFWGCQAGEGGAIVYHKEPNKASQFVHGEHWKGLQSLNPNLLIMHARSSSIGVGDAAVNKNNHPFVNADKSVGLVHNGRIWEYNTLKKRYNVRSDCDSEVLLRIFENARLNPTPDDVDSTAPQDILNSMLGIREIFSYVNDSHMAVAIGERGDGTRRDLWLFHNDKRPLWVIDARDALGQVFFCSTPDIWAGALRECPHALGVLGGRKHTIVPMPTEEVWYFSVDDDHPVVEGQGQGYYAFRLQSETEFTPWDADGPLYPVPAPTRKIQVISGLGENDEVVGTAASYTSNRHKNRHEKKHRWEQRGAGQRVIFSRDGSAHYDDEEGLVEITDVYDDTPPNDGSEERLETRVERYNGMNPLRLDENQYLVPDERNDIEVTVERNLASAYSHVDSDYDGFDVGGLEHVVKDILQTTKNIETSALNMAQEGSLTAQMFHDNLESLLSILTDLKGTQHMLESF